MAYEIGYAKPCFNLDELNIAKGKRKVFVTSGPATIRAFWLGPAARKGFDKACVPVAEIVTAVGDYAITGSDRFGCIACDVVEWHGW